MIDRVNLATKSQEEQHREQIAALFPNCVEEDGNIDLKRLAVELGQNPMLVEREREREREKYQFTWPDKSQAIVAANSPTSNVLRPDKSSSEEWETTGNLYIEGDNLEVLKLLRETYYKRVKMIYIDPPYNTGKDFIYRDNYRLTSEEYAERSQVRDEDGNLLMVGYEANNEANGRFHTDWLNMIYPRLKVARDLLTDDGVIFISIDDNEVHNLRKVCDEIFGEQNFVAQLIWQKKTGASDAKAIATITEDILVYQRKNDETENTFTKNTESYDVGRYKYTDSHKKSRGSYYIDNLDRGGLQYSDALNYGIECPDGTITFPNGRKTFKNDGWIWKWSKNKVKWALSNDFLEFRRSTNKDSGWSVCYKNYMFVDNEGNSIERGAPHKNLITEVLNANAASTMKSLFGTNRYFEYSKPIELVMKLISMVNTTDSIILDFFSGSATTAHAVMQLNAEDGGNRRFIMVQLPEKVKETSEAYKAGYRNICEIGKERIRRAGAAIKKGATLLTTNLDTGFRVFRLDSSNRHESLKMAGETTQDDLFAYRIKSDRTADDLLAETLLRYGFPLSVEVAEVPRNSYTYYRVEHEGRKLVACFGKELPQTYFTALAEERADHFVCNEHSLLTDALKDNIQQVFTAVAPNTMLHII